MKMGTCTFNEGNYSMIKIITTFHSYRYYDVKVGGVQKQNQFEDLLRFLPTCNSPELSGKKSMIHAHYIHCHTHSGLPSVQHYTDQWGHIKNFQDHRITSQNDTALCLVYQFCFCVFLTFLRCCCCFGSLLICGLGSCCYCFFSFSHLFFCFGQLWIQIKCEWDMIFSDRSQILSNTHLWFCSCCCLYLDKRWWE